MTDWKNRLRDLASTVSEHLRQTASRATEHVERTRKAADETFSPVVKQAAEYMDELYDRWIGEDNAVILDECPVATGILGRRTVFESDTEVFGQLYNVRVRPVLTAAILGATGSGMLAFDEALSRITRHIFDGDQLIGSWAQDFISSMIGQDTAKAINRFMDTVPGSTVPGGGLIHRIQHGHDLEAIVKVFQEHGSEGGIQALYHVFGRDFFTPAGIPILPVGRSFGWLDWPRAFTRI